MRFTAAVEARRCRDHIARLLGSQAGLRFPCDRHGGSDSARPRRVPAARNRSHRRCEMPLFIEQYCDIFTGVACMPGEHHVSVDKSVPPVIHASSNVPLNVSLKVRQQLNDMERPGIFVKLTEPTECKVKKLV
jgi:hypothetical protein